MSYSDKASLDKLGILDPELAEFLKTNPLPPPADYADHIARRQDAHLREQGVLKMIGPPGPELSESYQTISMRDGWENKLKIIKPADTSSSKTRPLVVLFYGGGFMMGSCEQLTAPARSFARLFGAVTVCPSYRLAPEYPFPYAPNDGWDAIQWIGANAEALGANPQHGFIVGGVSAGAHIASVVAQLAQDTNMTPRLTGQYLSVPTLMTKDLVPEKYKHLYLSRDAFSEVPGMSSKTVDIFSKNWSPDVKSPLFSPLNAKNPIAGLPKTYIQVDGMDPLRDDGLILDKILHDHGIETRLDVYPGVPHAHWAFLPTLKISAKAAMDVVKGVGWLLGEQVDDATAAKAMAIVRAA